MLGALWVYDDIWVDRELARGKSEKLNRWWLYHDAGVAGKHGLKAIYLALQAHQLPQRVKMRIEGFCGSAMMLWLTGRSVASRSATLRLLPTTFFSESRGYPPKAKGFEQSAFACYS